MSIELIVLRLVHILGGIFWVGAFFFNAFFLIPTLGRAGAAAGPIMAGLQQRRLGAIMPIVALLTILSGARLMWIMSGGFSEAYFESPVGRTFSFGAGAAVLAFLSGFLLVMPIMNRMTRLTQELGSASEGAGSAETAAQLAKLQRWAEAGKLVVALLLLAAAAAMAVARYMG